MTPIVRTDSNAWRDATAEVKRAVPLRQIFEQLGWRRRGRGRCDCGLCKGSSRGTVSFNDGRGVWKCHRCGEGGDVYSLIEKAHNCDFMAALKYLADQARIELPTGKKLSPAEHERLAREQAEREHIGSSAGKLDLAEQSLCVWYCATIQRCERKQDEVRRRMAELHSGEAERWRGEYEGSWSWLAVLTPLVRQYLAGYTLLAFGCAQDRARFVLRPQMRHEMIDRLLAEGGSFNDDGKWMEVLE